MAMRSHNDTTIALVLTSVLMFAFCWANATHLMGATAALKFVLIAVTLGWYAEQMGVSRGWFFGSYTYTDLLGWPLGDVPMVIPLMWFALCYTAYIVSHFAVWQNPLPQVPGWGWALFMAFLAAMVVTAYDLGADPYMVFVLKAWVMGKKDGWWFGETLQGFVGWVFVALVILFSFHLSVRRKGLVVQSGFTKWHALLPFSIYGFSMVFQMLNGHPVETRTVAVFAMGVPLLCALAGWLRWNPIAQLALAQSPVTDARLGEMQYVADPLADETIAMIVGQQFSTPVAKSATFAVTQSAEIASINRQFPQWATNQSLLNWKSSDPTLPSATEQALQRFLQAGQTLPHWADQVKLARAEELFMDYGALSCTLLFCSSLPECYVIPDLSAVLHTAGQLEHHTDYRIRATAAMIFPVMMQGGLAQPEGSGVAQILKVRLIHACIRNLILRDSPADVMAQLGDQRNQTGAGVIAPLAAAATGRISMHQSMAAHGWKVGEDGLPCNQEELAYTLLTFGYVFLRSMRKLGLGLSQADEEAFLHTWNVVGHVLGIRRELLADTMPAAEALFAQMQARGRLAPVLPDARPALGEALMASMSNAIPFRLFKSFPILMTRYLCGHQTATEIGISGRVSGLSHALFALIMTVVRLIDAVVRWVVPEFSISRLITRVLGYHLMSTLLLDQTRPLNLPAHLLNEVSRTIGQWSNDPKASGWLNRLEDRLTRNGLWNEPPGSTALP